MQLDYLLVLGDRGGLRGYRRLSWACHHAFSACRRDMLRHHGRQVQTAVFIIANMGSDNSQRWLMLAQGG